MPVFCNTWLKRKKKSWLKYLSFYFSFANVSDIRVLFSPHCQISQSQSALENHKLFLTISFMLKSPFSHSTSCRSIYCIKINVFWCQKCWWVEMNKGYLQCWVQLSPAVIHRDHWKSTRKSQACCSIVISFSFVISSLLIEITWFVLTQVLTH